MFLHMVYVFGVTGEEVLYGYGPLGVGVVVLSAAVAKLFSIVLADRNKAVEDRDAMLSDLFTKVLPAIARNTEVLENRQILDRDLIEAIKASNTLREETRLAFEGSKRAFEDFRRTNESLRRMIEHGEGNSRVGGT